MSIQGGILIAHVLFSLTSSNIDRFSNSFHCQNQENMLKATIENKTTLLKISKCNNRLKRPSANISGLPFCILLCVWMAPVIDSHGLRRGKNVIEVAAAAATYRGRGAFGLKRCWANPKHDWMSSAVGDGWHHSHKTRWFRGASSYFTHNSQYSIFHGAPKLTNVNISRFVGGAAMFLSFPNTLWIIEMICFFFARKLYVA